MATRLPPCLLLLCITVLMVYVPASSQITLGPGFTVSKIIKNSEYPDWPDSVGANVVRAGFDINNNGKKEFIVLADPLWGPGAPDDSLRPYLLWFEASGNDAYDLLWSTQIPGSNRGYYGYADFTVGDVDKDGNAEIIVCIPRARNDERLEIVLFYEFEGSTFPSEPTFLTDFRFRTNLQFRASRVLAEDVDGDGEVELIVTSRRDDFSGSEAGRTLVVAQLVGGDISPFSFSYFETEFMDSSAVLKGGAVYDLGITDFDKDGKKEIWVFTWDLFSLAIYEATGADTYALQADINEARPDNDVGARQSLSFYDADGDGRLEFYVAGITDTENPGNIHFIGNTTDVSTLTTGSVVTLTADLEPIAYWTYEAGSTIDIDKDGKMDYIVAGAGRKEIFRLKYNGGDVADSNNYDMSVIYKDETPGHADFVFQFLTTADDLDGDGKREILIGNREPRVDPGTDDERVIILEAEATTGVEPIAGEVPSQYQLAQNYPNPFNPATTIQFSIVDPQFTTLKLYDMLGREVATLVSQEMEAGSYRVRFDARGLPSGTYVYVLRSGTFGDMRKMILLK